MVLLEFFIDIIVPAALRPGGRFRLWHKWGLKRPISRADDRTTFLKSGSPTFLELSGSVHACSGLSLPYFYLHPFFHSTISRSKWLSSHFTHFLTVSSFTDTVMFMYNSERCHYPELSTRSAFHPSCCAIFYYSLENTSVGISECDADNSLSSVYICKYTKRN